MPKPRYLAGFVPAAQTINPAAAPHVAHVMRQLARPCWTRWGARRVVKYMNRVTASSDGHWEVLS